MRKSLPLTVLPANVFAGVAWGISATRPAPRENVLVAREMAFYIGSDDTPDPRLGSSDSRRRLHGQTMRGRLEGR